MRLVPAATAAVLLALAAGHGGAKSLDITVDDAGVGEEYPPTINACIGALTAWAIGEGVSALNVSGIEIVGKPNIVRMLVAVVQVHHEGQDAPTDRNFACTVDLGDDVLIWHMWD